MYHSNGCSSKTWMLRSVFPDPKDKESKDSFHYW